MVSHIGRSKRVECAIVSTRYFVVAGKGDHGVTTNRAKSRYIEATHRQGSKETIRVLDHWLERE